jgi:hypothetical protein
MHDSDVSSSAESGGAAVGVLDRESVRWHAHGRVDLFNADSVEACRVWHGLDREPISVELFEWALATRGSTAGDDVVEVDGNILTRLGLARLGNLFIGATGAASQALNASHCRIGVGDTNTAAATTDTDLSAAAGSTHRQFKTVDSIAQGTGSSSGVTTIVATFGTSVANFSWAEWGIDGGTADGTTVTSETASTPGLCNHKVPGTALLTKTTSVVAVFTATLTIA